MKSEQPIIGQKLERAIEKKKVTVAEVAREFRVKPPSVHGWIKTGRISKTRLPALSAYFGHPISWFLEPGNEDAEPTDALAAGGYNKSEIKLVRNYRLLDDTARAILIVVAESLAMRSKKGLGKYPFILTPEALAERK